MCAVIMETTTQIKMRTFAFFLLLKIAPSELSIFDRRYGYPPLSLSLLP